MMAGAPPPPPPPPRELKPQGFTMWCHNTTLEDGTLLDNDEPAPEFILAALEERTGIKRPENAARMTLHQTQLHFTAGPVAGSGGSG